MEKVKTVAIAYAMEHCYISYPFLSWYIELIVEMTVKSRGLFQC